MKNIQPTIADVTSARREYIPPACGSEGGGEVRANTGSFRGERRRGRGALIRAVVMRA